MHKFIPFILAVVVAVLGYYITLKTSNHYTNPIPVIIGAIIATACVVWGIVGFFSH